MTGMNCNRLYLGRVLAVLGLCVSLVRCTPSADQASADVNLDSLLIDAVRKTEELKFETAHAELAELEILAHERRDELKQIQALINMGILYLKYNEHDEALRYLFQSLELAQKYKREEILNTIYNDIGVVYSTNDATPQAIDYYKKALAISEKQGNRHRIALNLLNLGTEMHKLGDDRSALQNLHKAERLFRDDRDTANVAVTVNNIGDIAYSAKNYDSALLRYRQAHEMSVGIRNQFYQAGYLLSLGRTYYYFGQYDSAAVYIARSIEGFERMKDTENIIDSYRWLSRIHTVRGNMERALYFSNLTLAWKDTLSEEKKIKWTSEAQMKYEYGKMETAVELLQEEAGRQRQFWIGVTLIGIVIGLLVISVLRTKYINLQQRNVILQKEQEVDRLTLEKNRVERDQLERDMIATERLNALEQERLRQELTFKDRELASKALHLVNKNETFASIHKLLATIELKDNPTAKTQLDKAKKIIRGNDNSDQEWEAFKLHFQEVHPQFFHQLQEAYPDLSANDLRLSAYLLIDLNSKEIAQIFNISPESVRKKKQRLREKLNLEKEEDIKILLSRYKKTERV
jgi:tetratricopeptide (TPR) repeat protein